MNAGAALLPTVAVFALFLAILASPIWLAARIVGAEHTSLIRAVLALGIGIALNILSAEAIGGMALLFSPIIFLIAFKYVLGTSFFGALILGIVACTGYAILGHLFHGFALSVS